MRRLFWTFPDGLPGAGLLLMRLATAGALLYRGAADWPGHLTWRAAEGLAAMFLLGGLGTPFAGAFIAVVQSWRAYSRPEEVWVHGLLGILGASVALIGPGAASLDAWIFGWRRIDVGPARSSRLERGDRGAE